MESKKTILKSTKMKSNHSDGIIAQTSSREINKITKRALRNKKSKKDGKYKLLIAKGYVTFKSAKKREEYINRVIEERIKYYPSFKLEDFKYSRV
jgi:hypothetical protein